MSLRPAIQPRQTRSPPAYAGGVVVSAWSRSRSRSVGWPCPRSRLLGRGLWARVFRPGSRAARHRASSGARPGFLAPRPPGWPGARPSAFAQLSRGLRLLAVRRAMLLLPLGGRTSAGYWALGALVGRAVSESVFRRLPRLGPGPFACSSGGAPGGVSRPGVARRLQRHLGRARDGRPRPSAVVTMAACPAHVFAGRGGAAARARPSPPAAPVRLVAARGNASRGRGSWRTPRNDGTAASAPRKGGRHSRIRPVGRAGPRCWPPGKETARRSTTRGGRQPRTGTWRAHRQVLNLAGAGAGKRAGRSWAGRHQESPDSQIRSARPPACARRLRRGGPSTGGTRGGSPALAVPGACWAAQRRTRPPAGFSPGAWPRAGAAGRGSGRGGWGQGRQPTTGRASPRRSVLQRRGPKARSRGGRGAPPRPGGRVRRLPGQGGRQNDAAVARLDPDRPGGSNGRATVGRRTRFGLQAFAELGSRRRDAGPGKDAPRRGLTQYQQSTTGGLVLRSASLYDTSFAPSVVETAQSFPAFKKRDTFPLVGGARRRTGGTPPRATKEGKSTRGDSEHVSRRHRRRPGQGPCGSSDGQPTKGRVHPRRGQASSGTGAARRCDAKGRGEGGPVRRPRRGSGERDSAGGTGRAGQAGRVVGRRTGRP